MVSNGISVTLAGMAVETVSVELSADVKILDTVNVWPVLDRLKPLESDVTLHKYDVVVVAAHKKHPGCTFGVVLATSDGELVVVNVSDAVADCVVDAVKRIAASLCVPGNLMSTALLLILLLIFTNAVDVPENAKPVPVS